MKQCLSPPYKNPGGKKGRFIVQQEPFRKEEDVLSKNGNQPGDLMLVV